MSDSAVESRGRPRRLMLVVMTLTVLGTLLVAPPRATAIDSKSELLTARVPSMSGHPAGRLVNGKLPGIPEGQGLVMLAGKSLIALGRTKGRGAGAVATVYCNRGGVSWPDHLVSYDARKRIVGHVDLYRHTRGGREHVRKLWVSGRTTHVQVGNIAQDRDIACCGAKSAKLTFRWDKDKR